MKTPPSANCRGWLSGWHFTPEPERLFEEVANPMLTKLEDEPLTVGVRTKGLRVELSLPADLPARCEPGPSGIAIHLEAPDRTQSAFFYRNDPNSLLIETEDHRIGFASDGDVQESGDGTTVVASAGDMKIVMIIDWNANPVRAAIVSGTGDRLEMATKARGLLFTSAKAAFEARANPSDGEAVPGPHAFFKSLLQPVSPATPYPWIASTRGEPVSDLPLLALVALGSRPAYRNLAAGFIGNLVELIDGEGALPVGRAQEFPMLLQLIARFHEETGSWPRPPATDFNRYTSYLKKLIQQHPAREAITAIDLQLALVAGEIEAWHYIHKNSGRPVDAQLAGIEAITQPIERNLRKAPPPTGWLELLYSADRRKDPDRRDQSFGPFARLLQGNGETSHKILLAAVGLLVCGNPADEQDIWVSGLRRYAESEWQRHVQQAIASARIINDPASCAAIALGIWASKTSNPGTEHRAGISRRFVALVTRRPMATGAIATGLILLFAGWLVAVQFRKNYSDKSFVTQLGMLQQLYTSGEFESAMARIDELQHRGNLSKVPTAFIRGKILYRQKKFSEAAACFELCYAEQPENPAYLYNLALSSMAQGNRAKAIEQFKALSAQYAQINPAIAARAAEAAKIIDSLGPPGNR